LSVAEEYWDRVGGHRGGDRSELYDAGDHGRGQRVELSGRRDQRRELGDEQCGDADGDHGAGDHDAAGEPDRSDERGVRTERRPVWRRVLSRSTYQWQKNTGTGWAAIAGATGASYTTPATTAGDSGSSYQVVVTNAVSSVTSSAATLTVTTGPAITTQPANQ